MLIVNPKFFYDRLPKIQKIKKMKKMKKMKIVLVSSWSVYKVTIQLLQTSTSASTSASTRPVVAIPVVKRLV